MTSLAAHPAHPKRIVFFGTPHAAVPPLTALVEAGFDVPLVVSRADRRRGRRQEPTPSPVKAAALDLGIDVATSIEDALDVGADLGVVVAYGRLIPTWVLEQLPMLNVHFSLLPRWRGAAPVQRAILAGDQTTGVCIMGLEPTLDTGPVFARAETDIADATTDQLTRTLAGLGAELLVETLRAGLSTPDPQVGEPTYAAKIERDDLQLRWVRPAAELARVVQVGGAWTSWRGKLLKVHEAEVVETDDIARSSAEEESAPGMIHGTVVSCGEGALRLHTVQPEGKARVDASAWANGARIGPDDRMGS